MSHIPLRHRMIETHFTPTIFLDNSSRYSTLWASTFHNTLPSWTGLRVKYTFDLHIQCSAAFVQGVFCVRIPAIYRCVYEHILHSVDLYLYCQSQDTLIKPDLRPRFPSRGGKRPKGRGRGKTSAQSVGGPDVPSRPFYGLPRMMPISLDNYLFLSATQANILAVSSSYSTL